MYRRERDCDAWLAALACRARLLAPCRSRRRGPGLPDESELAAGRRGPGAAGLRPARAAVGPGHRGVDLAAHRVPRCSPPRPARVTFAAAAGRARRGGRRPRRGADDVRAGASRWPRSATRWAGARDRAASAPAVTAARSLPALGASRHGDDYLNPLLLVGGGDRRCGCCRPTSGRWRSAGRRSDRRGRGPPSSEVSTFAAIPAGRRRVRPPGAGCASPRPSGCGFHPVLHVWKLHDGTDFGAACGTPIRAPPPGGWRACPPTPATGTG